MAAIRTAERGFMRACRIGLRCGGSLDASQHAFDEVALAIGDGIAENDDRASRVSRDYGLGSLPGE